MSETMNYEALPEEVRRAALSELIPIDLRRIGVFVCDASPGCVSVSYAPEDGDFQEWLTCERTSIVTGKRLSEGFYAVGIDYACTVMRRVLLERGLEIPAGGQ